MPLHKLCYSFATYAILNYCTLVCLSNRACTLDWRTTTTKGHHLYACVSQQQPMGKQASSVAWQQVSCPAVLPSDSDLYWRNLFKAVFLHHASSSVSNCLLSPEFSTIDTIMALCFPFLYLCCRHASYLLWLNTNNSK